MSVSVHRQAGAGVVTRGFVRLASVMLTVAMLPLTAGICLDTYLISHVILRQDGTSRSIAAGMALLLAGLWFGLPALGRARRR